MKNIINWFVKSSADPQKVALTVKGMGVGVLPVLVLLGANSTDVEGLLGSVVVFIAGFFGLIAAGITAYGFVRKIVKTVIK